MPFAAHKSGQNGIQEMLLDQSIPDAKKIGILYRDGLNSKAVVSGSILTNLIITSSNESLKAVALFKLGRLKECAFASTFLIDFAKDNTNTENTRWVAIEALASYANQNVSAALLSFATNRDVEASFRIRALTSLRKCQPTLYESAWQQIRTRETNFAAFVQPTLYPSHRSSSLVVLDTLMEEKLRNRLEGEKGDAAFYAIQELAMGKDDETVEILIARYNFASDKNRAEIVLSLAKIAKREKRHLNKVMDFMVSSKERETSVILKKCIQDCIDFLKTD